MNSGATLATTRSKLRLRNWLLKKPGWLDHQTVVALIFALKTYAAAMLSLLIAFRAGLDTPRWSFLTSFIVMQPNSSLVLADRSGLLGISGIRGDMRALKGSKSPDAAAAIEHLVYNIVKFTGALMTALGGLDAFVFTASIGENDASLRAAVVEKLAWLGIKLDDPANARNGPRISTDDSKASAWAIPTNEE
jgi:acetate kinase